MNLDRVQVGKQFSTELYEKYSIIYEPALALFENDDLKKLRLTDKELQQNLQYNQTMFRELINPTKAKALKFRDIKIKDLSLDKYQIQDMYQKYKLCFNNNRHKAKTDPQRSKDEVIARITTKEIEDYTFKQLRIEDYTIINIDSEYITIFGLVDNKPKFFRFIISFIYYYPIYNGMDSDGYVYFVKDPLSKFPIDFAISFTDYDLKKTGELQKGYHNVKVYFLIKYHSYDQENM